MCNLSCRVSSSEEIFVAPPRRQGTRRPQNNMGDDDHMNTKTNQSMYTRGGSGGQQCPGSLDDCVALCPSQVILITKIIKNWQPFLGKRLKMTPKHVSNVFRRGCSRRALQPAADGAARNNIIFLHINIHIM